MLEVKMIAPDSPLKTKLKKIRGIVEDVLRKKMQKAKAFAQTNVTGGGSSKTKLNVRSGALRASITTSVSKVGNKFIGLIGSNLPYARVHETGKPSIIRPKKAGGALTIPMQAAVTGAGATRMGARSYPDAFIINTGEKAFIVQEKGEHLVFLFQLVKFVRTKKRPYLLPALNKIRPMVMEDIEKRMSNIAKG